MIDSPPDTPPVTHHHLATADGSLPLTLVRGRAEGPAVVFMPSAFGVSPDLEAQMRELASEAGLVVTFDPFFREDAGCAAYDDMRRVMHRVRTVDFERAYGDLRAVLEWARFHEGRRPVLVVGICLGGPYALRAAADGAVDGVITWHGTRMEAHLERAADMRCPMRLHFGSADPVVPPQAVEAVRKAFPPPHDVRVVVHDGATHGFSHRGAPHAYDERAEKAGMESVRELIHQCSPPSRTR